ncbi:MAG: type II secretion system ATPase GspE [Fimbriimonadales bacterium]|nr:type II secretion system ATPase GspE [Fimbriimonadales bacterium]
MGYGGATGFVGIADLFLQLGLITEDQLHEALQKQHEGVPLPLEHLLVQLGHITEKDRVRVMGQHWGIAFVDLVETPPDPQLTSILPPELAKRYRAVPVAKENGRLIVALADPLDIFAIDEIRQHTKHEIEAVIATEEDIHNALKRLYRTDSAVTDTVKELMRDLGESEMLVHEGAEEELSAEELREIADDAPVVRLANMIITQAITDGASDIHIEPTRDCVKVRYRIDGVMIDSMVLPKRVQASLTSRFKILADMDIAEKRVPQDNRISATIDGREYDFRVSTLPCIYGEKIVMRVLDKSSVRVGLEKLGFLPDTLSKLEEVISRSYGIILVTGPTGSGKSTTLYSILSRLNTGLVNIITAEDPVEYELPGINQVQVNPKAGLTFASALRAMLRQDPDIIMVGEMRDRETATIAIEAALTGHLVLSTLHTNDSSSAPPRLTEMGVEPFMIASSLIAVLAQRLVRTLCPRCKEPYQPTESEFTRYGFTPPPNLSELTIYRAKGCENCKNTGYKGRTGIHELLVMSDPVRDLILKHAAAYTIQKAAVEQGMRLLKDDALEKVLLGRTSIEEVVRVIYSG